MGIWKYINDNLVYGLKKNPFKAPIKSIYLLPFFIIFALLFGFYTDIFEFKPIASKKAWLFLPITLLILPSFFEEVLFRGLIIPISNRNNSLRKNILYVILSTVFFVLWHPLNAIINPISSIFFLNPFFLIIVAFLGVVCAVSYIISKSLWVPIFIHWLTVLVWVLLLGGRNLLLDN